MKNYIIPILILMLLQISCKKEPVEASLIDIFPVEQGERCEFGGYRFVTGLDQNENGILEVDEVQDSVFLCNESDDFNTLIDTEYEDPGINCSSGGLRVLSGRDLNSNDTLEAEEVNAVEYVCNGSYTALGRKVIFILENYYKTDAEEGAIGGAQIKYFNLLNYPGVDSVSFEGLLKANRSSTTCFLELYDVTHNVPIDCTLISSDNSYMGEFVRTSSNFISEFPDTDIDLSFRIWTSEEGRQVEARDIMLILHRSEEY